MIFFLMVPTFILSAQKALTKYCGRHNYTHSNTCSGPPDGDKQCDSREEHPNIRRQCVFLWWRRCSKFKSKQNQKMSSVKPKAEVISVRTDDEAELLLNATLKTKQQWACAFDL